MNSRYVGSDVTLLMERVIQDLGAAVKFLKDRGYQRPDRHYDGRQHQQRNPLKPTDLGQAVFTGRAFESEAGLYPEVLVGFVRVRVVGDDAHAAGALTRSLLA